MHEPIKRDLDDVITRYDLLKHPYYEAWSCGHLTGKEIADYAEGYFHHVDAFPYYLESFAQRLPEGKLRNMVEEHQADEEGKGQFAGQPHGDMWLDFACGMGKERQSVVAEDEPAEVGRLMTMFRNVSEQGSVGQALAAFYTYESQTPRVAQDKAKWLRQWYQCDDGTCKYFDLHANYDIEHANDWLASIERLDEEQPEARAEVLNQTEETAKALWAVLDGFQARRVNSSVLSPV